MENLSNDCYLSIQRNAKGLFKDRGSKFLAFAFPLTFEHEVKLHLQELKKEYHDAKHHCYAYRLGIELPQYRVNDDGEPSGTAGRPIYGQILSFGLTNILIVVIRYFGGTLLGTSGLINAYRTSAKECIQNATIVKLVSQEIFSVLFSYVDMNAVMRIMKEEQANIVEQNFDTACSLKANIPKSKYARISERLGKIEHVTLVRNEPMNKY